MESMNQIKSKLKEGPRITLLVYKNGATNVFESTQFIWSFIINLLSVATLLFLFIRLRKSEFKSILITYTLILLLLSLIRDLKQMNWHFFPLDYALSNIMDKLISLGLLVLLF